MRPRTLVAVTPAKVNLGLEIIGRRADGYHELVTLMHTISIFDTFEWTPTGSAFEYSGPAQVPSSDDLALRALQSAPDFADWTGNLRLRKRIPLAAGLGGGSSDAALALRIAHPNASDDDLRQRGSALGADVPFFVRGGAALASGSGTDIAAAPAADTWLVVVTPPLMLPGKTRQLFGRLAEEDFSDGHTVRRLAANAVKLNGIQALPPNAFTRQLYAQPVVRYAHAQLTSAGAPFVVLSGAGPSLYSLLPGYAAAAQLGATVAKRRRRGGCDTHNRIVGPSPRASNRSGVTR